MKKNKKAKTQNKHRQTKKSGNKLNEIVPIVRQFMIVSLVISLIALAAAMLGVESQDFWEVIRSAMNFQSIFQGVRMLSVLSK